MIHKTGDYIVYTSANGERSTLEAIDSNDFDYANQGCVGLDSRGECGGACCTELPPGCSDGFVWKEAV